MKTARRANVRAVRHRCTVRAMQRAAAPSNESPTQWVSFEHVKKVFDMLKPPGEHVLRAVCFIGDAGQTISMKISGIVRMASRFEITAILAPAVVSPPLAAGSRMVFMPSGMAI